MLPNFIVCGFVGCVCGVGGGCVRVVVGGGGGGGGGVALGPLARGGGGGGGAPPPPPTAGWVQELNEPLHNLVLGQGHVDYTQGRNYSPQSLCSSKKVVISNFRRWRWGEGGEEGVKEDLSEGKKR